MTHGSLFSGIGGFDLAAEWMGWENKFHCEWNPFGQRVLKYYWPNAETFTDITKSDFTKYANTIDILTGGFPCQPYSQAGKRKGKEDERHLWPEMLRAIKEIAPSYIVGENVRGLTNWNGGLVFDEVCAEMENIGYQVAPVLIPACGVGAPHRRERIWFVAYRDINGFNEHRRYDCGSKNYERGNSSVKWSANTKDIDSRNTSTNIVEGQGIDRAIGSKENGKEEQFANSRGVCGLDKTNYQPKGIVQVDANQINNSCSLVQKGQEWIQLSQHRGMGQNKNNLGSSEMVRQQNDTDKINRMERDVADTKCVRLEHGAESGKISNQKGNASQKRNQFTLSTKTNGNGHQSFWEQFPTVSPICNGDDGISDGLDGITFSQWRKESIKAGGNAIVPQVAFQIFKVIQEHQNQIT